MMTILITGASSGIGRQLALDYLAQGHRVWACGREPLRLAELAEAGAETLCFDARDATACRTATARVGRLDLLILNAGTCEYLDHAQAFDGALFARVIEANLLATGYTLEALLPKVVRGGRLALMSSSVTWLPLPRAEAYGASKAAIDYLAGSLRVDLAEQGIGVSLIRPGFVATPLTARNDFPMPALLSVEDASLAILRGLARRQHEIHFPRRFIWLLRLLGGLPTGVWLHLTRFMTRNKESAS